MASTKSTSALLQHRAIAFAPELWSSTKRAAKRSGVPIREFISEALDEELPGLVQSLSPGRTGARRKLVRVSICDNAIGRINHGRRETGGIPAVLLLKICLARHAAKDRSAAADRPARRPSR